MQNNQHATRSKSFVTVEVAAWVLVVLLALVLRLVNLDAAPLNPREAHEATLAWQAVVGEPGWREDYSPVLLGLNVASFAVFGAGDVLARWWPACFGAALVLSPFLLRRHTGRLGALAAGLYLAISPAALVASRQLDGTIVAAVGSMVFLGGLVQFVDTDRRAWLAVSAGGLALAVGSSPAAYSLLLSMGLAGLTVVWSWPQVWRVRSHLKWMGGVFLVCLVGLSTGLGINLMGLREAGGLIVDWVGRFRAGTVTAASPLVLLPVYEPLALVLGLGGLVWAMRRGCRAGGVLGVWAVAATLLLSLMPGRTPTGVLGVVLPLAALTGLAVDVLFRGVEERGEWLSEGLYVPIVVIVWVHACLTLARYGQRGASADLVLVLLAIGLQVLLAAVFAFTIRMGAMVRGVALGAGCLLLVFTFSAGWGVTQVRPADPREPLLSDPTAPEVRDLVETLRVISWRETGLPVTVDITYEAPSDSVLAWYLRDFVDVRRVDGLSSPDALGGGVVITRRREVPGVAGEGYVGQDFVLGRRWERAQVRCVWGWPPQCQAAVKWWLFRHTPAPPAPGRHAVLWVDAETLRE